VLNAPLSFPARNSLRQKKLLFRRFMACPLALIMAAIPARAATTPRVVHAFVALADNLHQDSVPVPAFLGNGQDSARNLYWGADFGVKTYFKSSPDCRLLWCGHAPTLAVLERCLFKSAAHDVYLAADAYQGSEIRACVTDFLSAPPGLPRRPF
jgi:hypothetical protein